MTHLECNPRTLGNISNQGGLRFHESEVQMGLPQSDLFPLSKSFQTAASSHPRRILPGLRLQPQIRHPVAQWSRGGATTLGFVLDFCDAHPGGGWLSVLGAPQSSPTVMAPLGYPTLRYLGPSPKAVALDQPRHHRPATQAQKTPTQNGLYGRTKPGTLLKHHIPINRLLGCKNPRLYRNRPGLPLRQLREKGVCALA